VICNLDQLVGLDLGQLACSVVSLYLSGFRDTHSMAKSYFCILPMQLVVLPCYYCLLALLIMLRRRSAGKHPIYIIPASSSYLLITLKKHIMLGTSVTFA
jgi:hypothetical protein